MKIGFLATGNELLLGLTQDEHLKYLAQQLMPLGLRIHQFCILPDDVDILEKTIKNWSQDVQWLIISGGLGPTSDDRTRDVVAKVFDKEMTMDQKLLEFITEKVSHSPKTKMSQSFRTQAQVIQDFKIIYNHVGVAPGLYYSYHQKHIVLLPGPKKEFQAMVQEFLIPKMKPKKAMQSMIIKTLRTCGIGESRLQDYLKHIEIPKSVSIHFKANPNQVDLRLETKKGNQEKLKKDIFIAEKNIRDLLDEYIFGVEEQDLAQSLGILLKTKKKTLACAESCTGGMIAKKLTDFSGSSQFFKAGWVLYSNEMKHELFKVPEKILNTQGAVSSEVALILAEKARKISGSDYSIATTGIAGPSGGTKDKPVGLVYIAIGMRNEVQVQKFHFKGSRESIREQASIQGLEMLRRQLTQEI